MAGSEAIKGPFGTADHILSVPVGDVVAAYRRKCGVDVSRWFGDLGEIRLFQCRATGYRFWRPAWTAGDEQFYAYLSQHWPDYYRTERWEYPLARKLLRPSDRVLEVGCGRGFFLRSIEGQVDKAIGLEFNARAIAETVTSFDVICQTVEHTAGSCPGHFDIVCSFQVLEHVVDPYSFVSASMECLRPGGFLVLATPNHASAMLANREDAFDLPPHHMGHFSADVYRLIAPLVGATVESIHVEKRHFMPNDSVTESTRARFVYRAARRLSATLMSAAYRWSREPGNNILVIMRRLGTG